MERAGDHGLVEAVVLVSDSALPETTDDGTWISSLLERNHASVHERPLSMRFLARCNIIFVVATAAFLRALAECDDVRFLSATTVDFLSG
jgi:hypothetical protein